MSNQPECESCRTTPPGFFQKYKEFLLSPGIITASINTIFLIIGFALEFSGNHQWADYSFLISAVVGGFPVFKLAVTNILRDFDLTAGVMVSVAMIAALIVGEYGAMALVAFMMVIGEALEDFTREKADQALKELNQLIPAMITIRMDGEDVEIPIDRVRKGDIALIRPGGRIPVDGTIVEGTAAVDQSSITGESMPIDKASGEKVYAGTFVSSGALTVEVEEVGETTTLGKMIQLVEEAQSTQAPVQRVANRYANFFAPVAITIAGIVWMVTGEPLRGVTMLVAICPCSLVLATPTSIVAAIGNMARNGVLVKHGTAMEQVGKVDVVAFDKTGTVTFGEPIVTGVNPLNGYSEDELLKITASAERSSEHPLAKAIIREASDRGLELQTPEDFESLAGHGISARVDGKTVAVGEKMLEEKNVHMDSDGIESSKAEGYTVIPVAVDGELAGYINVADTVRPESAKAIKDLKKLGISKTLLITGDSRIVGEKVGGELGVSEIYTEVLPEKKLEIIRKLQSDGHRVAYIGDGVNDAPALATADIGIAMGSIGTAVAMETADVVLLTDEIGQVPYLIELSQATMANIRTNIAVSMTIVLGSVAASALGVIGPVIGAIMHEVAAVPVIANAATLIGWKSKKL
ncbi:Cadmium-transporting ATPase [subsurface metagenome]